MANTPEHDMDQLLKRYVKQRREEAPPSHEMLPATRQALRAEVARTFRKSSTPPAWLRFFIGFWPRLAFGGGLIVVLAVSALVSLMTERKMKQSLEFAKIIDRDAPSVALALPPASPAQRDADSPALGVTRRSISQPAKEALPTEELRMGPASDSLARGGLDRSSGIPVAEIRALAPAQPTTVGASDLTLTLAAPNQSQIAAGRGLALGAADATSERAGLAQLSAKDLAEVRRADGAVDKISLGADLRQSSESEVNSVSSSNQAYYFAASQFRAPGGADSNAPGLLFNQVAPTTRYRRNFNSPAPPNVLTKFEFQRQGANVVVIDADGSVYEGTVQPMSPTEIQKRGVALLTESKPRAVQTKPEAGDGQLRNQLGAASRAAEAPAVENLAFRAEGTNRSLKRKVVFTGNYFGGVNPQLPILQNEKIEGNASVGGSSVKIEAVRVRP